MSRSITTSSHVPVLLEETIRALDVQPGGRYIDCTLGGGGHASAILEHSSPGGQLLGIDADPAAIAMARVRLELYRDSVLLVNRNFVDLQSICIKYDFFPVHGILFDLGLSTLQLSENDRGFSFQHDAALDMRLSPDQEVTAADIVNNYTEVELNRLIRTYGEEFRSRQIANRIVKERPIKSTIHLSRVIEQATGGKRGKIHPATKTFQALRIAVNHELENLESALKQAVDLLGFEGRLVVISYHSLEDRIVKQLMQNEARGCLCPPSTPVCICGHKPSLELINRRVVTPSESEVKSNPRSRSAKLRSAKRVTMQEDCCCVAGEPGFLIAAPAAGWRRPALIRKLRVVFAAS